MKSSFLLPFEAETTSGIMRGVVTHVTDETIEVLLEASSLECDRLDRGGDPLYLRRGDTVLVWHSGRDVERGVLLGRIGCPRSNTPPASQPTPLETRPSSETPDELVIEANKALTLRVGDGSITIRADGKILIRGSDLVSHAQRSNRIRGGSVTIN
jgi:hypothetical protein